MPTELGFGADLDRDGRITPHRWVDINRDGQRHWFEVEERRKGKIDFDAFDPHECFAGTELS